MTEDEVLLDPGSSEWLRNTLRSALLCDPVTVANEAGVLVRLLHKRLELLDGNDILAEG